LTAFQNKHGGIHANRVKRSSVRIEDCEEEVKEKAVYKKECTIILRNFKICRVITVIVKKCY